MTITLELPDAEPWLWITLGVAAWYVLAALIVRFRGPERDTQSTDGRPFSPEIASNEYCGVRLAIWFFSPLLFPVIAALWAVLCVIAPDRVR